MRDTILPISFLGWGRCVRLFSSFLVLKGEGGSIGARTIKVLFKHIKTSGGMVPKEHGNSGHTYHNIPQATTDAIVGYLNKIMAKYGEVMAMQKYKWKHQSNGT